MLETIDATVAAAIQSWPTPECYYLALSGGRDSCVLLDILAKKRLGARLNLLHVNHGLQTDADAWQQHCRELAQAYGLDFASYQARVQLDAGWGVEMAARKARLDIWAQHLPAGSILLQAHHQRDQAETTLQNIMRSGQALGMPAFSTRAHYRIGRPMLTVPYQQVVAYAQTQRLRWREDPSNDDTRFTRNHLRHEVLPLLEARWPRAQQHLAELGISNQNKSELQKSTAQALLAQLQSEPYLLSRSSLQNFPTELRQSLLQTFIANCCLPPASYKQLREFDRQLYTARSKRALLQLGAGELRADKTNIIARIPSQ